MVILQLSNRNSVNGVASCTLYCKRHKPYKSTSSPQECVTVTIAQIPYSGNLRSKSQFICKFGPYTWLRSTSWRSVNYIQASVVSNYHSKLLYEINRCIIELIFHKLPLEESVLD